MSVPVTLRPLLAPIARSLAQCALAVLLFTPTLAAQHDNTPGWPLHSSAPDHAVPDATGAMPPVVVPDAEESCLLWSIDKMPGTVSAADLKVPGKAKGEYHKACSDLKDKKLASAEDHVRKAVQIYPQYAAAWALLGQVLAAGDHVDEARDACSQASGADAGYAPAYLCLADIAAQNNDWHLTLNLADRSLALAPQQNIYGHFYSAVAQFHLEQLPEAQNDALKTINDDHSHRLPQVRLLLAQIYGAQHDLYGVSVELRAYLKAVPNAPDADAVRKRLAEVETQISK